MLSNVLSGTFPPLIASCAALGDTPKRLDAISMALALRPTSYFWPAKAARI